MSLTENMMHALVNDPLIQGGKVSLVYPPKDGEKSDTLPCDVCEKSLTFKPDSLYVVKAVCCRDCKADWMTMTALPASLTVDDSKVAPLTVAPAAAPLRIAKPTAAALPDDPGPNADDGEAPVATKTKKAASKAVKPVAVVVEHVAANVKVVKPKTVPKKKKSRGSVRMPKGL